MTITVLGVVSRADTRVSIRSPQSKDQVDNVHKFIGWSGRVCGTCAGR